LDSPDQDLLPDGSSFQGKLKSMLRAEPNHADVIDFKKCILEFMQYPEFKHSLKMIYKYIELLIFIKTIISMNQGQGNPLSSILSKNQVTGQKTEERLETIQTEMNKIFKIMQGTPSFFTQKTTVGSDTTYQPSSNSVLFSSQYTPIFGSTTTLSDSEHVNGRGRTLDKRHEMIMAQLYTKFDFMYEYIRKNYNTSNMHPEFKKIVDKILDLIGIVSKDISTHKETLESSRNPMVRQYLLFSKSENSKTFGEGGPAYTIPQFLELLQDLNTYYRQLDEEIEKAQDE
jgi:hypothetical protein